MVKSLLYSAWSLVGLFVQQEHSLKQPHILLDGKVAQGIKSTRHCNFFNHVCGK